MPCTEYARFAAPAYSHGVRLFPFHSPTLERLPSVAKPFIQQATDKRPSLRDSICLRPERSEVGNK